MIEYVNDFLELKQEKEERAVKYYNRVLYAAGAAYGNTELKGDMVRAKFIDGIYDVTTQRELTQMNNKRIDELIAHCSTNEDFNLQQDRRRSRVAKTTERHVHYSAEPTVQRSRMEEQQNRRKYCGHCNMIGHSEDQCRHLNNGQRRSGSQPNDARI